MTRLYVENPVTIFICDCCKKLVKERGEVFLAPADWRTSPGLFTGTEQHACDTCQINRKKQAERK